MFYRGLQRRSVFPNRNILVFDVISVAIPMPVESSVVEYKPEEEYSGHGPQSVAKLKLIQQLNVLCTVHYAEKYHSYQTT